MLHGVFMHQYCVTELKEHTFKVKWHAVCFLLFQSAACTNIETVDSQLRWRFIKKSLCFALV